MSHLKVRKKFSFIFICQKGELEIKASILAASLKENIQSSHELIAAIPQPESVWGSISSNTLRFFEDIGVKCLPVYNPIGEDYPIGNKLSCLGLPSNGELQVFLDSDIMCMGDIKYFEDHNSVIALKPADLNNTTLDNKGWGDIYKLFDVDFPRTPVFSTISKEMMAPYFNAGVLFCRNGRQLVEIWQDMAIKLRESNLVPRNVSIHLDQISLPVALAKLELEVGYLSNHYNYPANLQPLDVEKLPALCHYHSPTVIMRELPLLALLNQLLDKHPMLAKLMEIDEQWLKVGRACLARKERTLAKSKMNLANNLLRHEKLPEVIITGIPRSGTSFLCGLFDKVKNVVAINEPKAVFQSLKRYEVPFAMALFYRSLRQTILDNELVENKLCKGEVVEDTVENNEYSFYRPKVITNDFVLVTKNTLAYLARLPMIHYSMKDALIIGCIRHPYDTINSWKRSFPHLSEAKVESIPIGNVTDPFLTDAQRISLQVIANEKDMALKRALWWRYLANTLFENQDKIITLRYEDWVTQPSQIVGSLLHNLTSGLTGYNTGHLKSSAPRIHRDRLDRHDIQCINSVCHQVASDFGYIL